MARKRTGSIQRRGDSYRIAYRDLDGARQYETVNGSFDDAQRVLATKLGDLARGMPVSAKAHTILFEQLAADVEADYVANGFSSLKDVSARFRLHILPVFGPRKAASITTPQLTAYVTARKRQGAKVGTINRELEAIRHAFRLGMIHRRIFTMPHVPHLREKNTRTGFFSPDEVDRLCAQLKQPIRSFVRFGFLTGWRIEEIRTLEWRQVDFSADEIRLDPDTTKNLEGRVFPMTDELRELLEALKPPRRRTLPRFVFQRAGKPVRDIRKAWTTANRKAGLPMKIEPAVKRAITKGKNKGKVVKVPKRVSAVRIFHDLRRSAAKYMQSRGLSEGVIMRLMGHKTRSMFDRYAIVSPQDLRDAAAKLNGAKTGAKANGSAR